MTYEHWAFIADLYIPLLLLSIVVSLFKRTIGNGFKAQIKDIGILLASVLVVYVLMFLDIALNLWSKLGLDYSTHTALALALLCFFVFQGGKLSGAAVISIPVILQDEIFSKALAPYVQGEIALV